MAGDTPQVTITHHVQGQGGKYIAHLSDSSLTGILEWEPRGGESGEDVRVATHTIVPREIGGRGVAGQLVDRLVADARRLDFKIVPQCSYVSKKFDEHPDWSSLIA